MQRMQWICGFEWCWGWWRKVRNWLKGRTTPCATYSWHRQASQISCLKNGDSSLPIYIENKTSQKSKFCLAAASRKWLFCCCYSLERPNACLLGFAFGLEPLTSLVPRFILARASGSKLVQNMVAFYLLAENSWLITTFLRQLFERKRASDSFSSMLGVVKKRKDKKEPPHFPT